MAFILIPQFVKDAFEREADRQIHPEAPNREHLIREQVKIMKYRYRRLTYKQREHIKRKIINDNYEKEEANNS